MSSRPNWIKWIRVLSDPYAKIRGFSLEGLEFRTALADPVQDEMFGTLPGDKHKQRGNFWVISEKELMRVCPEMAAYAKGVDWFFPVEFCDPFIRPEGVVPVPTRNASASEAEEAMNLFKSSRGKLSKV